MGGIPREEARTLPKKGHTEEQIVAVLRQVEAGALVEEVCRKTGISVESGYVIDVSRFIAVVGKRRRVI